MSHIRTSARRHVAGGALGTALLVLTALALIGFIALTTLRDRDEPQEATQGGSETGVADAGDLQATPSAKPEQRVYPDPELSFTEHSEGLPTTGTWLGYPTLADLDGDGDLDAVASNREEDGVSTWRFTPDAAWELRIEELPRDMSYGPTGVADIDADGDADLLIGDHTQALRAFLNDGAMTYGEAEATWPRPNLLKDLEIADLNQDGHPDVVTICHFKGGLNVYLGNGHAGFFLVPASAELVDERVFGRDVELVDVDLDGVEDIAVTTDRGLKCFLTFKDPETNTLSWKEVSTGLPAPSIGNSIFALDSGRFDESIPNPQLVMCMVPDPGLGPEEANAIGVFAFDAQQEVWRQIDSGLSRAENYKDCRAADFNGDGHVDILAATLESGRLIYLGDGTGKFRRGGRLPGHGKVRYAVGDIDADGWPDVLVASSAQKHSKVTGKIRVFMNHADAWK